MYDLNYTQSFASSVRMLIKKNRKLIKRIDKSIEQLRIDPFYPALRSHVVNFDSKVGSIWSSRVTGDIRILWAYIPNQKSQIILLEIGSHDEVY